MIASLFSKDELQSIQSYCIGPDIRLLQHFLGFNSLHLQVGGVRSLVWFIPPEISHWELWMLFCHIHNFNVLIVNLRLELGSPPPSPHGKCRLSSFITRLYVTARASWTPCLGCPIFTSFKIRRLKINSFRLYLQRCPIADYSICGLVVDPEYYIFCLWTSWLFIKTLEACIHMWTN